jgi:hypothetical protein
LPWHHSGYCIRTGNAGSGFGCLYLTDDHAQSASALEKEGIGISPGNYASITLLEFSDAIKDLLYYPEKRDKMGLLSQKKIDGFGANRISKIIIKSI